jgi:hypothetical protein
MLKATKKNLMDKLKEIERTITFNYYHIGTIIPGKQEEDGANRTPVIRFEELAEGLVAPEIDPCAPGPKLSNRMSLARMKEA